MNKDRIEREKSVAGSSQDHPLSVAEMRDRMAAESGMDPVRCLPAAHDLAVRLAGQFAKMSGSGYFRSASGYLVEVNFADGGFSAQFIKGRGQNKSRDALAGAGVARSAAERLNSTTVVPPRRG